MGSLPEKYNDTFTGLSLRAGGRGFPPPTIYECGFRLLSKENRRKTEPKEIPSCLIPRLLVVFTWQLEILVTTPLYFHPFSYSPSPREFEAFSSSLS